MVKKTLLALLLVFSLSGCAKYGDKYYLVKTTEDEIKLLYLEQGYKKVYVEYYGDDYYLVKTRYNNTYLEFWIKYENGHIQELKEYR